MSPRAIFEWFLADPQSAATLPRIIINVTRAMRSAIWLPLAVLASLITGAITDQTIFDKELLQRRPDVIPPWPIDH